VGIHDEEQVEEVFVPDAAPQLRSFALNSGSGPHVLHLLNDRRSNGIPVLDFGSVRRLSVKAENERDLVVIQGLIKATQLRLLNTLVRMDALRIRPTGYHMYPTHRF
jgi:hypothetical protein